MNKNNENILRFWEQPPEIWDDINNVGLRNHYICTVYAARMMVERRTGLIVNVSSPGGLKYLFNVAYGIGKAAVDRMAVDCAFELRKKNVAMLSLYPGAVKTELIQEVEAHRPEPQNKMQSLAKEMFEDAESIEFSGKVIVKLAQDIQVMKKYSGKIVLGAEYAQKYGIRDIDNRVIYSFRQLKYIAQHYLPQSWKFVANFIPAFVKIPNFLIDILTSKLA